MTNITLHPELQILIPPLTTEEMAQLTANLRAEGCREALIVWEGENVLLDGHNRLSICHQYDLPYTVQTIPLVDLDAAKAWMLRHQLGRRNLTAEQMSYLRGEERLLTGQTHGGDRNSSAHFEHLKNTDAQLADKHKVSQNTIRRDASYAKNVDTITAVVPEAKQAILARDTKVGRQEVKQLATLAKSNPQTAKHVIEDLKTVSTPKAAKRIVREAMKQTPIAPQPQRRQASKRSLPTRQSPQKRQASKPSLPTSRSPQLTLVAQEAAPRKGLETLLSADKREMFIVHNPESKPVFNKTNEMVDWASWTWNPVTGCWHGCDYCYARGIAHQTDMAAAYPKQFEPTFHPARLNAPANTKVPREITRPADRNVFTCSMADLFGRWVPNEWIMQVFERVALHPEWNFLFLTKFPQRLQEICDALNGFPDNAWVGCTVDAQARVATAERAFTNIRAKVRWLSVEPMRERLTFNKLDMFDWLVMGGQSASAYNKTPAFQPEWEWVEHLWQQARAAGAKIYWKENLTVRPKEVPWDKEENDAP